MARWNSGRWLHAEEVYVDLAIACFLDGILDDCPDGTTLRQYIAHRLSCDDMRVTKKLRRNKLLAGRRVIQANYNRRHFARKQTPLTEEDMDAVTATKLAFLAFETAYRAQKKPWRRDAELVQSTVTSAARRVAIPALLNELHVVPPRPSWTCPPNSSN
ncbi:hypothetical protein DYB32_007232 [Aphanomyces invadans]|uniref:Uncharacterized protein n=1 Tax=Aphanomyces invadans TaxID=157072 RepID=A0A418AP13_9STRA|nr:hypothetical protein DYB32_007232 [Aphanomyces invadans]